MKLMFEMKWDEKSVLSKENIEDLRNFVEDLKKAGYFPRIGESIILDDIPFYPIISDIWYSRKGITFILKTEE